jgi:hypothetical protein
LQRVSRSCIAPFSVMSAFRLCPALSRVQQCTFGTTAALGTNRADHGNYP